MLGSLAAALSVSGRIGLAAPPPMALSRGAPLMLSMAAVKALWKEREDVIADAKDAQREVAPSTTP